jgi:hypothetical protein
MNGKFFYVERSPVGYGTHVWIGRVRLGSRKTMTPMWPHVRKGGDEFCNDVLSMHLYPLVAIDIWWRPKQRTWRDGMCDSCKQELRDGGWSEQAIATMEAAQMKDGAFYDDHRKNMKDPAYRAEFERELREIFEGQE